MSQGFCVIFVVALVCLLPQATYQLNSCAAVNLEARVFFEKENELLRQRMHEQTAAAYAYNTNVTEENRQAMIAVAVDNAEEAKRLALRIRQKGYDEIDDELISRQAAQMSRLNYNVLESRDFQQLYNAISAMQSHYAKATVCDYQNSSRCDLTLEPHIDERFRNSRDPDELAHYWRAWYDAAGTPMRDNFATYVKLANKAAHLNNRSSYAEEWISHYDDPDFEQNLDAAYNAIMPLYREIHAYVRHRLREHYGADVVPATGNIPMHLLGNLWAQQWYENIELFTPFPDTPFVNVDAELQSQGYTVKKMFELGDDFFKSLNMRALPESFWNHSVLERPADRPIVCHASAWDLFQDSDVRIKMCTDVNTHYLYVVHHELGHIQYYLQYENQPAAFRKDPNPGFHEAIGDVIGLSVATPKHLNTIGLRSNAQLDEQSRINELFKTALQKVVFLPFSYSLDKYRYAVFRGDIDESVWNCAFWRMRSELTGVEPPFVRTDLDFDPPAKYHVDADVEYLRYFAAHIFQFQFLKALCIKADEYDPNDPTKPLDNCDIYDSVEAGRAFAKFLSYGASRPWKEVLEEFTGDTAMDPTALLDYFAPLHEWLRQENRRLGVPKGWDDTNKVARSCEPTPST